MTNQAQLTRQHGWMDSEVHGDAYVEAALSWGDGGEEKTESKRVSHFRRPNFSVVPM